MREVNGPGVYGDAFPLWECGALRSMRASVDGDWRVRDRRRVMRMEGRCVMLGFLGSSWG